MWPYTVHTFRRVEENHFSYERFFLKLILSSWIMKCLCHGELLLCFAWTEKECSGAWVGKQEVEGAAALGSKLWGQRLGGACLERVGRGGARREGRHLRTGLVLKGLARLLSPSPFPLMADILTSYAVSGFSPVIVNLVSGRRYEWLFYQQVFYFYCGKKVCTRVCLYLLFCSINYFIKHFNETCRQ